jgi:CubicO group peptidase (beta-lactamase class C family)
VRRPRSSGVDPRVAATALLASVLLLLFFGSLSRGGGAERVQETGSSRVRDEIRPLRDSLVPQIEAMRRSYSIPGLSLAVVQGDDVLWLEGFGDARQSRRTPATPDTVFEAGSLAKPFTALAVMQLAAAGRIEIDRPLRAYLPELAIRSRFGATSLPTVRNVLSHHAGFPSDLTKGMWSDAPLTSVTAALGEEYMAFPPNLVFSYSNVGYTLLGHAVERVTGAPYAVHMDRAIFAPLGMTRTAMGLPPVLAPELASGHRDGREVRRLPIRDLPALGLYTTAADLARFMRAFLGGEPSVIADRVWRTMLEPQNRSVALDLHILVGLGWLLETATIPGGGLVVRHGGTTLAYSSELILLPEHRLGVAMLANSRDARTVIATLAEEILARLLEARAGEPSRLTTRIDRRLEESRRASIEGSYATDFGLIVIDPEKHQMCACLMDQVFDLIEYPDGWFGLSTATVSSLSLPDAMGPLAGAWFRAEQIGGREVIVATTRDQRIVLGEKVAAGEIPTAWVERVGRYDVLNPDAGFPLTEPQLQIRQGRLCMSYKLPELSDQTIQVPLQPVSDTEAIILGLGRTRGETVRAVTVNGEERLRYSGYIGRRLPGGG